MRRIEGCMRDFRSNVYNLLALLADETMFKAVARQGIDSAATGVSSVLDDSFNVINAAEEVQSARCCLEGGENGVEGHEADQVYSLVRGRATRT
eukprot:6490327-Amphidinium_carterae.1